MSDKANSSRGEKPAQGSKLTPLIAGVTKLRAEWLASGKGPKEDDGAPAGAASAHMSAKKMKVRVKETQEEIALELTERAIIVASMFMDLNRRTQNRFLRQLEVEHALHEEVPNERVVQAFGKLKKRSLQPRQL